MRAAVTRVPLAVAVALQRLDGAEFVSGGRQASLWAGHVGVIQSQGLLVGVGEERVPPGSRHHQHERNHVRINRRKALTIAPLLAAAAAATVIPTFAGGSSHREAPGISQDPTADNTDVYAFVSPDDANTATLVANFIPFEEPAGGPNFYGFSDNVRYQIKIDNTGDGKEDIAYRFKFHTTINNPDSFLYNGGTVKFENGKYTNLNVVQTYDVSKVTFKSNGKVRSIKPLGRKLLSPPNNVGPKSTPDYANLVAPAIHSIPGGGKVFAGQRDDPFSVDLGATFDLLNIDKPGRPGIGLGNMGGGDDGLTGYNTHTIAIQVPKSDLTKDRRTPTDASSPSSVVGVYSTTERLVPVFSGKSEKSRIKIEWQQVSRLGNPLINEVVIPLGKKDRWNATDPSDDAMFLKHYTNPELAAAINLLFPGVVNAPTMDRQDLVTVLLKGLPPGNPTGLVTQIGNKPKLADLLRLNLAIAPAATPNRLGAVGGDAQGFPNGRRLIDDVVDIEEKAVAGALAPTFGIPAPGLKADVAAMIGDGVDTNDLPFLGSFPYVAPPVSGFDVKHPRPSTT